MSVERRYHQDCWHLRSNQGYFWILRLLLPASYTDVEKNSDAALMSVLAQQSVSVAIESNQTAFQLYKSGVFIILLPAEPTWITVSLLSDTEPSTELTTTRSRTPGELPGVWMVTSSLKEESPNLVDNAVSFWVLHLTQTYKLNMS